MVFCLAGLLLVAGLTAGCSSKPAEQQDAAQSFRQLLTEFKDRAARKGSGQLAITVSEQAAEAPTRVIRVRKLGPRGFPGDARKTAEVIDVSFIRHDGRWHCVKAVSQDFEGERVTGGNSLEGPDIRLSNLFIWMGLP
jgi:hypothetical protein